MNKYELAKKINELEGFTNEEKSELLKLLRSQKKYGLVWEDKPEDAELRMRDEQPVLVEVPERAIISDDADAPNHILIEGDNLEALTALSYTHCGMIDVIYIDPPYNTGNKDFVYNDSFVDKEDGYRHSKWLSFMNKRLKIAKNLLSEKGVIFISIDDNEQAQLKMLCDELFGNVNFLGQLILKTATDNNPSQINIEHEYMLCYCLSKAIQGNWKRQSKASKMIVDKYKELRSLYLDDDEMIQKELRKWIRANKSSLPQVAHYNNIDSKGVYSSSSNSSNPHPGGYDYDIIHPLTGKACPKPNNGWRWPYSTFQKYNEMGEIEWGKDDTTQPHVKKRIETSMEYLRTLIYEDNRGTTKELADMFGGKKVFENPKPQKVLSRIFDFASDKGSLILDFFAGSGTTLHATMQLNSEDGGHRQCILVTNNENGICENVTYERNRRVIQGYTTPKGEKVPGLTHNNLRYYKTKFVPRDKTTKNLRDLMLLSTDMLCIHNDTYIEKPFGGKNINKNLARYFENAQGTKRILVIYNESAISAIVQLMKQVFDSEKKQWENAESEQVEQKRPSKLMVYVFSPNGYAYDDEFEDVVDDIVLCAIPEAILNAYRRVLPKRKSQYLQEYLDSLDSESQDETGMESSERREADLFDFNNHDEIDMAASDFPYTREKKTSNNQDSEEGVEA